MTFNHLMDHECSSIIGCYVRGHHEKEVIQPLAKDWLKKEWDVEVPENAKVQHGYYKVVPTGRKGESVSIFRKHKMRGSFAVTQVVW